jgi:hypothetical protein
MDLFYNLPAPAWWPGPGGGPVPGYQHLVCHSHPWRKLPCLTSSTGRLVSVLEIQTIDKAISTAWRAALLQSLGLTQDQLVEALHFTCRYPDHLAVERLIEQLRSVDRRAPEKRGLPDPRPEKKTHPAALDRDEKTLPLRLYQELPAWAEPVTATDEPEEEESYGPVS